MINDRMKVIATQQTQNLVLKGNTIKYNNLAITLNSTNWDVYSGNGVFTNNKVSITGAVGRNGMIIRNSSNYLNLVNGHKYFKRFWLKNSVRLQFYCIDNAIYDIDTNGRYIDDVLTYETNNYGFKCDIFPNTTGEVGNFELGEVMVIDLTLLGLDNITTTAQFYATDLGKFIQNGNYLPYSATNTIYNVKTPFTFQTGIRYNNLVPNANRNFSNTTTDQRANDNFNFTIFDFSNSSYLSGKTITDNGFKNVIFSSQYDTNGVNIYHSGSTRNIDFAQNLVLKANHKYWCSFNCISHDSRVVGGLVITNLILIDLTELGMGSITTYDEFLKTDLGRIVKDYLTLNYSVENTYKNVYRVFTLQDKNEESLGNNLKVACHNGILTINGNTNGSSYTNYQLNYDSNPPFIVGHKYYIEIKKFSGSGVLPYLVIGNPYNEIGFTNVDSALWTCTSKQYLIFRIRNDNRNYENLVVAPLIIDLTEEYGSGNEPTTTEQIKKGWAYRNYFVGNTTYIRTKRVDLGTLNWGATNSDGVSTLYGVDFIKPITQSSAIVNARSPKYTAVSFSTLNALQTDKCISLFNGTMQIRDTELSGKNATQTRLALTGVILEYETAEPLELNGIGNNYDTFETKSGKVKSKFIKVNLASLTWTQYSTHLFGAQNTQINLVAPSVLPNAICSAYQVVKSNDINNYDQAITIDGQNLRGIGLIDNLVSSVAQLVSKLANEVMICERSVLEPILETMERSVLIDHRYTNVVDANGNEIDTD